MNGESFAMFRWASLRFRLFSREPGPMTVEAFLRAWKRGDRKIP